MSEPPQQPQQPNLSSLSASPTPPSSLPSSPNSLLRPSLHKSSKLSASLADAFLRNLTSEQYCDDGVDLVMDMFDNEKSIPAPLPPPDVDRLLASWKAVDWGSPKHPCITSQKSPRKQTPALPRQNGASHAYHNHDWRYSEDCAIADIFTRVPPESQREELRRRLPKRRWSDAQKRFQIICDEVCSNEERTDDYQGARKELRKGFWRRRNGNLKPRGCIAKTLSKLR